MYTFSMQIQVWYSTPNTERSNHAGRLPAPELPCPLFKPQVPKCRQLPIQILHTGRIVSSHFCQPSRHPKSSMPLCWGICSAGKISHDFIVALKTLPADHKVVSHAENVWECASALVWDMVGFLLKKLMHLKKLPNVGNVTRKAFF